MLKYNYEKQVIYMTQVSNQNDDARITGCDSCQWNTGIYYRRYRWTLDRTGSGSER